MHYRKLYLFGIVVPTVISSSFEGYRERDLEPQFAYDEVDYLDARDAFQFGAFEDEDYLIEKRTPTCSVQNYKPAQRSFHIIDTTEKQTEQILAIHWNAFDRFFSIKVVPGANAEGGDTLQVTPIDSSADEALASMFRSQVIHYCSNEGAHDGQYMTGRGFFKSSKFEKEVKLQRAGESKNDYGDLKTKVP